MSGIQDLAEILKSLSPQLSAEQFVFVTGVDLGEEKPWALIEEEEGATAILSLPQARRLNVKASEIFARITLLVHSSLTAVGLTAAVSMALARRGISANIVAGYYHDHIFVPADRAGEAIEVLGSI